MMEKEKQIIRPDILIAGLLSEIRDRIFNLEKLVKAKGLVIPFEIEVGKEKKVIDIVKSTGYQGVGFTIYNDGPDELFIDVNGKFPEQVGIRKGEDFSLDYYIPVIEFITLLSKEKSRVRIFIRY